MREEILSVGIDIGTSTLQLVFSKIIIENLSSGSSVPRISIVDKQIVYRSDIYFTPLISQTEIDIVKVKDIIGREYDRADISPADVKTGAVIITGETARKANASIVLDSLSGLAGDFVVATAGPDLESVLSAKGAGANTISKETGKVVANIDVGGGTSNIAIYKGDRLLGVSCLDIGGRLIKIESGKIIYIYEKLAVFTDKLGIRVGDTPDLVKIRSLCDILADILCGALNLSSDNEYCGIYTNNGQPIDGGIKIDCITFSGGVADYIYSNDGLDNPWKYGDIGPVLGASIRNSDICKELELKVSEETIRATVVGAGSHTTEISGSTISYKSDTLPLKNVPVLRLLEEEEADLADFKSAIKNQLPIFRVNGKMDYVAVSFSGNKYTSFSALQDLAKAFIEVAGELIDSDFPLIFIIEKDIAKAFGNTIRHLLGNEKQVISIDGIRASCGDYIDIGKPVAGGQVVPVVIKTIIFNS